METVSKCCLKPIIKRHGMEYPLGGTTYGQAYTYDACEGCGMEIYESVKVHECCGMEVCECGLSESSKTVQGA